MTPDPATPRTTGDSRPAPSATTRARLGAAAEEAIHALAATQHGVVSRRQLREAGLSASAVRHRVATRRLHRIHPGVFAVGHRLLPARGWWMAAVLAGGEGALLSHRAAAALWGLVDGSPSVVDVVVLRTTDRRPGLRTHRVRSVPDEDRAVVDGIPCTSVARTLVDLAAAGDERVVDRALRRAQDRRLYDRFALEDVLARARPGTAVLRRAMRVFAGDEVARRRLKAELKVRFLDLLRRHGFVLPSTNVVVRTPWRDWEVDTLWPEHLLIVELYGWWSHRDRESFRRDHRRATDLRATGHDVTRLSWEQVVDHEAATVERLVRILPRTAGASSPPRPADR